MNNSSNKNTLAPEVEPVIKLIPFKPEFIDVFLEWRNQPLSLKHNPLASISREELLNLLMEDGTNLVDIINKERFRWFIDYKGFPVGNVSLKNINLVMNTAEIAYGISEKHQGLGIATAAVKLMIEKVFSETKIRKLYALIHDQNQPSIRLIKRLGFQQEGYLREHYIINGSPANEFMFGLLKSDFQLSQSQKNIPEANQIKHVIFLENIEGVATTENQIKAHVSFLRDLEQQGKLAMCGPFTNYKGGMIILNVSQYQEAMAIAITDPFIKEKVRNFTIRTWALSNEENNHLGMG
jgi:RimJ/RimL family protein N-acetyltransferase/uncharacterized protein YciI